MSGGTEAWVTLATNDSYAMGALVLARSLTRVNTTKQLAVMITPGISSAMRDALNGVFDVVTEVNVLDSEDAAHLALLDRPELGITFTKIHCWKLTQFTKCVFLDADTLVIQNSDELFEREELSAAPDVGWPDCFNSGVYVFKPSLDTYNSIRAFAVANGSFDGGDQGLLNMYFNGWSQADASRRLPFTYNMVASASYSYLPAFKVFGQNVKIVHFIGQEKPWLSTFDSATGLVRPPGGQEHLQDFLQAWWNIFRSEVHPRLSPEMGGDENQSATVVEQVQASLSQIFVSTEPSASQFSFQPPPNIPQSQPEEHESEAPPPPEPTLLVAIERFPPDHFWRAPPSPPPPIPEYKSPLETNPPNDTHQPSTASAGDDNSNKHASPNDHSQTNDRQPSNEEKQSRKKRSKPKGIAAIYAKMSMDGGKSEDQIEYEDHMRKLAWEQGHIDYMGKDSFENIMKRIQVSMAQTNIDRPRKKTPPKQEASTTQQTAPESQKSQPEQVQTQTTPTESAKDAEKQAQEERLAIERKIAEQKKAAEQKLEAERQAAAARAAASAPPQAKVADPKAPPRKELTSILKKPTPILKATNARSQESSEIKLEECKSTEENKTCLKSSTIAVEVKVAPKVETIIEETVIFAKPSPLESEAPLVAQQKVPVQTAISPIISTVKENVTLSSKPSNGTHPTLSKEESDNKLDDNLLDLDREIIPSQSEEKFVEPISKRKPTTKSETAKPVLTEKIYSGSDQYEDSPVKAMKAVKTETANASATKEKHVAQNTPKQAEVPAIVEKPKKVNQDGSHKKDVFVQNEAPGLKLSKTDVKLKQNEPASVKSDQPKISEEKPRLNDSNQAKKTVPVVATKATVTKNDKTPAAKTVQETEILATSASAREVQKQETWSQKVAKSTKDTLQSSEVSSSVKSIPKKPEPLARNSQTIVSAPKETPAPVTSRKEESRPQSNETNQAKQKLPQKEAVQTKDKIPQKAVDPVQETVPQKEVSRLKETLPPKEVPAPKDTSSQKEKAQTKESASQKKKSQQKEVKPAQKGNSQEEKLQSKETGPQNDKSSQSQKAQGKDSKEVPKDTPSPTEASSRKEKSEQKGKQKQAQKEAPPKKEKLSKKQKAAQREQLRNSSTSNDQQQQIDQRFGNASPYGVGLGVLGAAVVLVFAIYAGYSPASFIL